MTQRDKARDSLKKGDIKQALKLAKTFDVTYTKEEIGVLETAYELLSGKESFYKQIGCKTEETKEKAIKLLGRLNEPESFKTKTHLTPIKKPMR